MDRFTGRRRGCNRGDHPRLDRRSLLHVGGMSLLGVGAGDLLRLEADAAGGSLPPRATARAIVFIFQSGGPSQHETWDPKPNAPKKIRGEYGVTQTRHPGEMFCEYLPKLAARQHRFSIVRTMHHVAGRAFRNEHNSCHYLLHTGTTALPPGDTNASIRQPRRGRISWPSIGSLLAYAAPSGRTGLPSMIELPRGERMKYPGRDSGLLGPRYDRLGVDLAAKCNAKDAGGSCPNCFSHDDPNLDPARAPGPGPKAWWDNSSCRQPDFHLPDFSAATDVAAPQLRRRDQLLRTLQETRPDRVGNSPAAAVRIWDAYRRQALSFALAAQPGRKNPFDLTQEPDSVRDLYGREEWGQGFLTARRLIEAGVRMVQVNLRGWDTHQNAFRDLKGKLLPSIDHCLSGFLDDLEQRGLLDQTLVVMCGEMGRTPHISPISPKGKNASGEPFTPGRHHWGDVFPCFFAGGGIQTGRIIGKTDRHGGVPVSEAYTPEDLAATIFHCLGIGPDREFHDAAGRPYRIYRGQPIAELL